MASSNSCEFCEFLKVQDFDMTKIAVEVPVTPDAQPTETDREVKKIVKKLAKKNLTKRDKKLRKIMRELIFLLGHNQRVNSIPEAVAALLKQNYPDLVEWNGDTKLVIFVPDYYLNKAVKYVNPICGNDVLKNLKEVAESNPDRREEFEKHIDAVRGAKRVYRGEVPERNLYDALKDHCAKSDESMAIFHGLNIVKFDPERPDNNVKEKDFILVSATHRYIAVIECKKSLGRGDSVDKSIQQLRDTKLDLESYFRNSILDGEEELSSDWAFIPIINCDEIEDGVIFCESCEPHIIKGKFCQLTKAKPMLFSDTEC